MPRLLDFTDDRRRHFDAIDHVQVVTSIGIAPIASALRHEVAEPSAPRHAGVRCVYQFRHDPTRR